jgi:hypothetical protein
MSSASSTSALRHQLSLRRSGGCARLTRPAFLEHTSSPGVHCGTFPGFGDCSGAAPRQRTHVAQGPSRIPALVAVGLRYSPTCCGSFLPAVRTRQEMWNTMKDRIASRIVSVTAALNGTPKVAAQTAAPRKVAKAPPPAVIYNWRRNKRRRDIGPAPGATDNRTLRAGASSDRAILTFTYH